MFFDILNIGRAVIQWKGGVGIRIREKELHVAVLLLFMLPVKSLTINTCCRVADFRTYLSTWRILLFAVFFPALNVTQTAQPTQFQERFA